MVRVRTLVLAALFCCVLALPVSAGGGRNRVVGSEATIHPVRAPITLDGDLREWDESESVFLTVGDASLAGENPGAFDAYNARIALRCDRDALYAAVWWHDPTPLGVEATPGVVPAGDGLVLHVPLGGTVHRLALWRVPQSDQTRALLASGRTPLGRGRMIQDVSQGYRKTGSSTYTQEARIPWSVLGGRPDEGAKLRLGIELCFGGLDLTAGYRAWLVEMAETGSSGSRWGGNIGWGFVDGVRDEKVVNPGFDPANGALIELKPAGTTAPPNPAVMFMGNECTRTTRMIALPARGINVDGVMTPDEWPEAAATTVASEPTLLPGRYETAVQWAFDDQGLYAGLRWRTGGPQFNINDPERMQRGYDGGDALQIRLGTDRVSHVDLWFYTAGWQPAMNIVYGTRFNEGNVPDALARGARLAISPLEDGGYTEEVFLPWNLITKTGKPLAEGGSLRVILDLFYSGLERNRLPFIVNAALAPAEGVATVPFTAPRDGYYTVTIDNDRGIAVRRLLVHKRMLQGETIAEWDGLDDDGRPAAPGEYTFRGLHHTGIGLKYLTTFVNPGTPPWQTYDGTGEWGGDHSPPQAVAADEKGVYLGWPAAEDGSGIIGCDFDGRKRWGFFMTPCPSSCGTSLLASDGRYLYVAGDAIVAQGPQRRADQTAVAYFQSVIACLDRETGQRRGFTVARPFAALAEHDTSQSGLFWWWDLWAKGDFSLDTYGIHDDYWFTGRCTGANLVGLAARDGRLYVSLRLPQQIVVYRSDSLEELARWPVAKPGGLAFDAAGNLLAVSGDSVVRVSTADGTAAPVIAGGLDSPVAVAADAAGNLYVSQWGRAQCVAAFGPDGKKLRTIGAEGGRRWTGAYDPSGMHQPRGIAVDREGKLWVAEDDNCPRRVSVWEAKTGKFVREFIGGTVYGGAHGGVIDPANPARAFSLSDLYQIDLSGGPYRPVSTLWRRTSADAIFPLYGWIQSSGYATCDGRRFIYCGPYGAAVLGELRQDGTWTPRAAIGGVFDRGDNPMVIPADKRWWRHGSFPDFFRAHAGENYVWTDANDDGCVQPDEMQWEKQTDAFPCLGVYWRFGSVGPDLDVVIGASGGNTSAVYRFRRKGWTPNGAPVYRIAERETLYQDRVRMGSAAVDSEGHVLISQPGEWARPGFSPVIGSYNADGSARWTYPSSKDVRPMGNITGDGLLGPVAAGGELGEIWSLTQWHGGHIPIMTTDGLFVGRLLRDPSAGGEPGPDVYRGETIQYLNRLADGRIILSHGKNAHHLMEVTGLDTVKRFAGRIALSPEQAALAAKRLRDREVRQAAAQPIPVAARTADIAVDGKLDEWDWKQAVAIGPEQGLPRAEFAAAYSAKAPAEGQQLYLAWKVHKGRPFVNTGDDPARLFVTGDAVDLQFCWDPAADRQRRRPIVGDCRLVISRPRGEDAKPVAMLYKALVPDAKAPVSFRSPTSAVVFDEVAPVPNARVAIVETADGYIVEAALPVRALFPDFLWPGQVIQGDAGVIVADPTGRRVARLYRFNRNTTVVNDLPTEAALGIPGWGELEVERPPK